MIDASALGGPEEAPASPPRVAMVAPEEVFEPLPKYNPEAEARRLKMRQRGIDLQSEAQNALPAGEDDVFNSARARRVANVPAAAPSQMRLVDRDDRPIGSARSEIVPGGRRREVDGRTDAGRHGSLGVGSMMQAPDENEHRPPRARHAFGDNTGGAAAALGAGGAEGDYIGAPMAAHVGKNYDSFAIGNPRAQNFVLRQGGHRMRVRALRLVCCFVQRNFSSTTSAVLSASPAWTQS